MGAVLLGGLLAWLGAHREQVPAAICGAARGACDALVPEEKCCTGPMPLRPLDGQVVPKKGSCPPPYTPINGGCWLEVKVPSAPRCLPPTFEYDGRCYVPLMAPPAKVPNSGGQK